MFSGDSLFALQVGLDHALRRAAVLSFPGFGEEEAIAVGELHDIALRTARAPKDCAAAQPLRGGPFGEFAVLLHQGVALRVPIGHDQRRKSTRSRKEP